MLRVVHDDSIQRHDREYSPIGQITHRCFHGFTIAASLESKQPWIASHCHGRLIQASQAHSRPVGDEKVIQISAGKNEIHVADISCGYFVQD